MTDNLIWFDEWYSKQTVDNYGNKFKIKISTKKDSGWRVEIDLSESEFADKVMNEESESSNFNKYSINVINKIFIGEGDFLKLDFLIGKFRKFIGKSEDRSSVLKDYFFNPEIQTFIFENRIKGEEDSKIYLHYTNTRHNSEGIIRDGFQYLLPFDKTTNEVKNDAVDLNYSHYLRKSYGDYIVIIKISDEVYSKYYDFIQNHNDNFMRVEELLSEIPPFISNDGDEIYTLSNKFIKGYINYRTGDIVKNKNFNPLFDSEKFEKNIQKT